MSIFSLKRLSPVLGIALVACRGEDVEQSERAPTPVEASAHCPSSGWPTLDDPDAAIYVDGSVDVSGDGSREAPFSTITEGVREARVRGGATVAIAAGTYPEALHIQEANDGLSLIGTCNEQVIIDGSTMDEDDAIVSIRDAEGTGIHLENLTISGGPFTNPAAKWFTFLRPRDT